MQLQRVHPHLLLYDKTFSNFSNCSMYFWDGFGCLQLGGACFACDGEERGLERNAGEFGFSIGGVFVQVAS